MNEIVEPKRKSPGNLLGVLILSIPRGLPDQKLWVGFWEPVFKQAYQVVLIHAEA